MRAFIYGTLKRGHRANHLLRGQSYLAGAESAGGYRLYDAGGFPGLVEEGEEAVLGEIWEIDAAAFVRLDEYEGVSEGLYQRGVLHLSDGDSAATYFYLLPTQGLRDCGGAWTLDDESRGR